MPQHFHIPCLLPLHLLTHSQHSILASIVIFQPLFNLLLYLLTLFHHFTYPFNLPPSQPSPSVFPMTPSLPFAVLPDPIKLFLAHFSARVTFQRGPQPLIYNHIQLGTQDIRPFLSPYRNYLYTV